MASLKSIALVFAVSLFGVSMVTSTAQAGPAPNKAATEKKRLGPCMPHFAQSSKLGA